VEAPTLRDDYRGTATWSARVAQRISTNVDAAHRAVRRAGRAFLGRKAVLAASFARRAASYEEKRGIIPTFAARLGFVREHLRRAEIHFRARYRAALERWRAGQRDSVFPFGTWWMRVVHAALVDAPLSA
jgi:putative transposase